MANELFAITGATGNVGKALAEILLAGGRKVRAIGRNPAHLEPLAARGAETVTASVDDQAAMTRAFAGATAALLMIPPNPTVDNLARYQERIITSLTTATRDAGVGHVVVISSIGAHLTDGTGPIKGLHLLEERVNGLPGVSAVHLRATYFMENHLWGVGMIKGMGVYGSAIKADQPIPMVASRDIAARAAHSLVERTPGKNVRYVLGPRDLTMAEATRILGAAIGKPDLPYVQFPYADAEKGMLGMGLSPDMAKSYVEMSRGFNEGRVVPTERRSKDNSTPTTLEEFAKTFAAAYNAG